MLCLFRSFKFLTLILFCGLTFSSADFCEAKELSTKVLLLINQPMSKADWEAYPELKELYDSDAKFIIVIRKEVPAEGNYQLSIKIQNGAGETIYSHEEQLKTRINSKKDIFVAFLKEIPLDQDLKTKFTETNTINTYCDGKIIDSRLLLYSKKNMLNPNIKQTVILPFFSDTNETLNYQYRAEILNTFSDAVNCEIKRVCSEVIPSYIAEQKTSNIKIKDCIKDQKSLDQLKSIFGADLYVFGNVRVPKYTHEPFELKVWVINAKTGEVKKFQDSAIDESERSIEPKIRKIIFNVFYKKGLLPYLNSL